ncbi:MAG: acyl-CoA thioesterase [Candidatus Marinimicrobia bacterium]|jgi:YbgC/YbaW family acyl-CoA thioester hydrolase|nr:acyl-CoA thioesterase [Candidatus Neomarinimicrobiota bacterium]MBT6782912.1 acyl-CoA thioesterase [Candidatus Neomarinimicrobiota bacterium]MBT7922244.1 acyl-CoA thioesterase [Candidatus Neomarinimicrobiota bacterium]MDP7125999.1 thioesterase family protein [Candidatus Neomarinimicrobiota bacterium]HCI16610.1 hypothetical protein [Candidatus Neomarinimicrobiota bacterium]|tara:strand:- start:770 stop:1186 length:417 start_codon:yes stop_codon:yes gene_type:complete
MAFTIVKKIRFDDVDGAGIVYYPQYFHLCHAAFEDFFDDAAHISYPDLISKERLGFPTVSVKSDFKAPLVYGDNAIIKLGIKKIGKSSLIFSYRIRRKRDGELCFVADVTTVAMSLESMKAVPIPDEYRKLFENFLEI